MVLIQEKGGSVTVVKLESHSIIIWGMHTTKTTTNKIKTTDNECGGSWVLKSTCSHQRGAMALVTILYACVNILVGLSVRLVLCSVILMLML